MNTDMELNVMQHEKNNFSLQTVTALMDSTFGILFLNLLNNFFLARETIKVGIIYVAKGQDNQKDILKNSGGSPSYEEFLESMGTKVALKSHLGFIAGLKPNTDGEYSIYFSNPVIEMMFHVTTMMPTEDEDDDQVLNKKR